MSARARAAQNADVARAVADLSGVAKFASVTRVSPLTIDTADADGVRAGRLRGAGPITAGDDVAWVLLDGQPVVLGAVDDLPPDPATEA